MIRALPLLLLGCTSYPVQPEVTAWPSPPLAVFLTVKEGGYCPPDKRACSSVRTVGDTNFCTITYVAPKDFNDRDRLTDVGHEVMHCLGRKHQ